jgi:hypothetical protein
MYSKRFIQMSTNTPWGKSQSAKKITRGIVSYSCAGHGGIHVSPTMNARMPKPLRIESGWYEEDCEWARVCLAFAQWFKMSDVDHAHSSLKNWSPDDYQAWRREHDPDYILPVSESLKLREREFCVKHANDYVTVSAIDSKYHPGMVEVSTVRGGRLPNGHYASKDEKRFLVPSSEYVFTNGSFVVDQNRYQEI